MKIAGALRAHKNSLIAVIGTLLLTLIVSANAAAQSTDLLSPLPIRSNEISGTIVPRDLGDARLTRHFYLLTGTSGDLIVTVESRNLEGDVDVFTHGTLRPLAKIPMYGTATSSNASKTIYFKTRESLILRVEGRTPNDDEGSYRVRFEGSFEPISADVPDPEMIVPTLSAATVQKGRRVTATGARIYEPEPEPQPKPVETAERTRPTSPPEVPTETAETRRETAKTTKPTPTARTPRNRRSRTPPTTRTRPTVRRPPAPVETPPAEVATGPRLILEFRDGMRIERYMTTVRRVTVENGQIIVITKNGKIDRQPMSNVVRMAIEP